MNRYKKWGYMLIAAFLVTMMAIPAAQTASSGYQADCPG